MIFTASSKKVANRVARGLGWMTRGRQTADPAERLLFFFTALEALLTHDDKSQPVVQTICRNASVVLSNNVGERYVLAEQLKAAYTLRSGLVHGGKREVSIADTRLVQSVTEDVYRVLLVKEAILDQEAHMFLAEMAEASYGKRWPLRKMSE